MESGLSFAGPLLNEPRCEKTGHLGFRPGPTQTAVQPHKMARGLKFQV